MKTSIKKKPEWDLHVQSKNTQGFFHLWWKPRVTLIVCDLATLPQEYPERSLGELKLPSMAAQGNVAPADTRGSQDASDRSAKCSSHFPDWAQSYKVKGEQCLPSNGGHSLLYENDSVCPFADLRRTLGNQGVRSLHQGLLNANTGSQIFHHEQHLVSLQASLEGEKDMNH